MRIKSQKKLFDYLMINIPLFSFQLELTQEEAPIGDESQGSEGGERGAVSRNLGGEYVEAGRAVALTLADLLQRH